MKRSLIAATVMLGIAWFATIMLAIWTNGDARWVATALFGWLPAFVSGAVASYVEDRL